MGLTVIDRWKKEAIASMTAGFSGTQERQQNDHTAKIKKLHAKIGQLTVEKDFLADASKRLGLFGIYPLLICAKTIERDKRMTLQIKKKLHIAEFKFKGTRGKDGISCLPKSRVDQLHLTCVTSNLGAAAFYQKQGSKIYGEEPKSLKIEDQYFNEYMMVLVL